MSDLKRISPLLDDLEVLDCIGSHGGTICYRLHRPSTGERYVLKWISVPESEDKAQALILANAVPNEAGANKYYEGIVNDIRKEVRKLHTLSSEGAVTSWSGYQVAPHKKMGFDVYLLMPERKSLRAFLQEKAITQLQALNLGIDLCNALDFLHSKGYTFQNIKPDNVFFDEHDRFLLGDLGLVAIEDLRFYALPEYYVNDYSAPELFRDTPVVKENSDIFALGMLLYYIFNGNHLPFDDGSDDPSRARKQRLQSATLPTPVYADYELAEIILQACNPDSAQRWQTPAELRKALVLYMQRNDVTDQILVPPLPMEEPEDPETLEAVDTQETVETPEIVPVEEAPVKAEAPELAEVAESIDVDGDEPAISQALAEIIGTEEVPDTPDHQEEPEVIEASEASETAQEPEAAPDTAEEPEAEDVAEDTQEAAAEPETQSTDTEEPVESPVENMTIDELLDSVNSVISQNILEETEEDTEVSDQAIRKKRKKARKKGSGKRFWITLIIVLLVLVGMGVGLAYLYTNWYLIPMQSLTVTNVTADSVTVSYAIGAQVPELTWTCTDSYGNQYPGTAGDNHTVTFTQLSPGMQYTILFEAGKLHRLEGTTSLSVATVSPTQIVSLSAAQVGTTPNVEISMVLSGKEPEEWTLTYSSTASESGSVTFSGHTVTVPNLTPNETYTFELQIPKDAFVTGPTSCDVTLKAAVEAEGLDITYAGEKQLGVTWKSTGGDPDSWHIQCTGTNYDQSQDVTECAATFDGIDLTGSYTFTLSAEGLAAPLTVTLPAKALIITDTQVKALDASSLSVTWGSSLPETPLQVRYTISGDSTMSGTYLPKENTVTLVGLPPEAKVQIYIEAVDGTSVYGSHIASATTAKASAFAGHELDPAGTAFTLHALPQAETWTYGDLADAVTTMFAGTKLAAALKAPDGYTTGDTEETVVTLVLRSDAGVVVTYSRSSGAWNSLWKDGYYLTTFQLPQTAGGYQLELYFNDQLVNKAPIIIS